MIALKQLGIPRKLYSPQSIMASLQTPSKRVSRFDHWICCLKTHSSSWDRLLSCLYFDQKMSWRAWVVEVQHKCLIALC